MPVSKASQFLRNSAAEPPKAHILHWMMDVCPGQVAATSPRCHLLFFHPSKRAIKPFNPQLVAAPISLWSKLGLEPSHGVRLAKEFHPVNVPDPVLRCHAILEGNCLTNESGKSGPIRNQVIEKFL